MSQIHIVSSSNLNDYWPITLTSVVMKWENFLLLFMHAQQYPQYFQFQSATWLIDESFSLHSALKHLDKKSTGCLNVVYWLQFSSHST